MDWAKPQRRVIYADQAEQYHDHKQASHRHLSRLYDTHTALAIVNSPQTDIRAGSSYVQRRKKARLCSGQHTLISGLTIRFFRATNVKRLACVLVNIRGVIKQRTHKVLLPVRIIVRYAEKRV
jgi:hypothetical protein